MDTVFQPFYGLDVEALYSRYHPIIDFLLFLTFFTAISRLTLGQRFPGRAGKALAVSIGFILTVSLVLAEARLGFSLRSFGPLAAGVLIGVVGFVIFLLIKHAGTGTATAGSLALIVTYFALRAVMPGFFLWVQGNPWAGFLHSLLVLAVFVSLFRLLSAVFGNRGPSGGLLKAARQAASPGKNQHVEEEKRTDRAELSILKHRLSRFTGKAIRNSEQIAEEIREIIAIVGEYGGAPGAGPLIAKRLRRIASFEHEAERELKRVAKLDDRLKRFDLSEMVEIKARYGKLSAEQKKACRKRFLEAREKFVEEQHVQKLTTAVKEYQRRFAHCVEMAVQVLQAGRAQEAREWLEKALEEEQHASELLRDVLRMEKRLMALVKKQIRETETAAPS